MASFTVAATSLLGESLQQPEPLDFSLRQAEECAPVSEVCRKMGISEQTFYRWKENLLGSEARPTPKSSPLVSYSWAWPTGYTSRLDGRRPHLGREPHFAWRYRSDGWNTVDFTA